jgi:hypothetical protein
MKTLLATTLSAAVLAATPVRAAEPYPHTQTHGHTVIVDLPQHVRAGDQTYPGTLRGLREMLDQQRPENPEDYARLDAEMRRLERRNIAGWATLGGIAAVGASLVAAGFATTSANSTTWRYLLIGGFGAIAVAPLALYIRPNRQDTLRFLNEYNRTVSAKADLRLGFNAGAQGGGVAVSMRF